MSLDLPPVYAKAKPVSITEIPIVDFAPALAGTPEGKTAVARAIGEACETVGFFYLVGHGVPQDLIDATFAADRQFFAQSPEDKARTAATLEHWRGWVPPKAEGEGGAVGGGVETFRLMLDLPPDDPDVLAGKPLHLPNKWPDHLPGFKATVSAYLAAMLGLAGQLRRTFALALGLPETFFEDWYRKPLVQLSLLHYRPPAVAGRVEIGAGEHRDTGAFTILMQDEVGGLEVQPRSGEWIAAPPIPGAYVINIGDLMMAWTNGRFVSTPHRVVNRADRPRYSIPFFANPDFDVIVEPLPPFVSADQPPRFAPLHNGRFMVDFYEKGMAYLRRAA